MIKTDINNRVERTGEAGFSYIDVLIAIIILSFGILGLTSAMLYSFIRSQESEQKLYAKQIAQSTVESVFVSRDMRLPNGVAGWAQVGNVGTIPNGIFVVGWHPVREDAGPDAVLGTADDSCLGTGSCPSPTGPANTSRIIPGYQRLIVIQDVIDPERATENPVKRRRITVTVRYQVGSLFREEIVSTMITDITT